MKNKIRTIGKKTNMNEYELNNILSPPPNLAANDYYINNKINNNY